jgi:hypothetical protein
MDKSPERNMREGLKGKDGRYLKYATCERCKAKPSSGLTIRALNADGSHYWEGYACKPCKKALKAEVVAAGGTYED